MLLRLFPKFGWLARWSIAYIVGMAAGLRLYAYLNSNIIEQIKASGIDFSGDWFLIINKSIILIGTIAGLVYFFFSKMFFNRFTFDSALVICAAQKR